MASEAAGNSAPLEDPALSSHMLGGSNFGPPQTFNISTNLIRGCAAQSCHKTKDLSRCSACKVVQYCGRDHQSADRAAHRSTCSKVKKATANLEKEERALKREEGDEIFVEERGHFWGIHETRSYMRARFTLVEALLKINTALAVSSALDHLLDMLGLCRGDNMGVRDVVPHLYLRLGRDQEAYDFCMWWATTGQEGDYDWGNTDLPYLDTKGADVFGDITPFAHKYHALSHTVAISLLKIRLLIDLQALQRAKEEAGPHVPREILDGIQQYSVSSVVTSTSSIIEREDQTPHIAKLRTQIEGLYAAVKNANPHFWPALIRPGEHLKARPNFYTPGGPEAMQLTLQYSYNAWAETPGAIGVIRELSKPKA
jgi:hypothetical protein